jgi:hypothetical protein
VISDEEDAGNDAADEAECDGHCPDEEAVSQAQRGHDRRQFLQHEASSNAVQVSGRKSVTKSIAYPRSTLTLRRRFADGIWRPTDQASASVAVSPTTKPTINHLKRYSATTHGLGGGSLIAGLDVDD